MRRVRTRAQRRRARPCGTRRETGDELAALIARCGILALVWVLRRHHVGLHAGSLLRYRRAHAGCSDHARGGTPARAAAARAISLRRLARRSSGGDAAALFPPRCGDATGRAPARVARGAIAAKLTLRHCRRARSSASASGSTPRNRRRRTALVARTGCPQKAPRSGGGNAAAGVAGTRRSRARRRA